jgi:hypothetical protein
MAWQLPARPLTRQPEFEDYPLISGASPAPSAPYFQRTMGEMPHDSINSIKLIDNSNHNTLIS